jgi:DNA repair exonuclease SbcCD ATPase subunit
LETESIHFSQGNSEGLKLVMQLTPIEICQSPTEVDGFDELKRQVQLLGGVGGTTEDSQPDVEEAETLQTT